MGFPFTPMVGIPSNSFTCAQLQTKNEGDEDFVVSLEGDTTMREDPTSGISLYIWNCAFLTTLAATGLKATGKPVHPDSRMLNIFRPQSYSS